MVDYRKYGDWHYAILENKIIGIICSDDKIGIDQMRGSEIDKRELRKKTIDCTILEFDSVKRKLIKELEDL